MWEVELIFNDKKTKVKNIIFQRGLWVLYQFVAPSIIN